MTDVELFRMYATEFSDVSDYDVKKWISVVKPLISKKRFGKLYQQAIVLLAAHKMKLSGLGDNTTGSVGDVMRVSSYSEGEVSVSYGVTQNINATVDAEYTLTIYGLQYLDLRRLVIVPILVSGERYGGTR